MLEETIIWVDGGNFCAGVVYEGDSVVACAPILKRHSKGRGIDAFIRYAKYKGWQVKSSIVDIRDNNDTTWFEGES